MSKTAFSDNLRPVNLAISVGAGLDYPIGGYKAIIDFIERIEEAVAKGLSTTDISGDIILKDLNNDRFYTAEVTNMRVSDNDYAITLSGAFNTLEEEQTAIS